MARRAGTVSVDVEPNLSQVGSKLDAFARAVKPLGLKVDLDNDFAKEIDRGALSSRRSLDGINTNRAQGELTQLGSVGERELGRIGSQAKLSSGALLTLGAGGIYAGSKIIGSLKQTTDAASDLTEAVSYGEQVFGSSFAAISKFADGSAQKIGQSRREAISGATDFATFGKAAGLAGDDLVGFSTDLVKLASDLASAKNTKPEEAITAISAALRGESEPIRNYGVLLDDATLRQEAFALGLTRTTKDALTPQQKVLAAQSAIFKQTSDAQGDFARTSDGAANAARIAAAEFENSQAKLGEGLVPVVAGATKALGSFLGALDKIPGATQALGVGIAGIGGAAILGGAASSIAGGLSALREFRAGAATAAITEGAVTAAAATEGVAIAMKDVAVSSTIAGSAGAAAMAEITAGGLAASATNLTSVGTAAGSAVGPIGRVGGAVKGLGSSLKSAVSEITPLKAGLGALAAIGISDAIFGGLNASRGQDKKVADSINETIIAAQNGGGDVARAFADAINDEGSKLSISGLWERIGTQFQLGGEGVVADIEHIQRAFDSLLASDPASAQALINSVRESDKGLDKNSTNYIESEKILAKWQKRLDAAAGAQKAQTDTTDQQVGSLERLGVVVDAEASKWDNYATVIGGIFDPIQGAISAQDALADGQQAVADAQRTLDDILAGNSDGLKAAAASIREARIDLNKAVAETGPGSEAAEDALHSLHDAIKALHEARIEAGKAPEDGDFFEDRRQQVIDAEEEVRRAQQKVDEINSGNSDEVVAARERLTEAEARYNDELSQTGPNSQAAADAQRALDDAQRAMPGLILAAEQAYAELREELEEHPEAIAASIKKIDEWVAKGLISKDVAAQWKEELFMAAAAAQALVDTMAEAPVDMTVSVAQREGIPSYQSRPNRPAKPKQWTPGEIYGPGGAPNFGGIPYRANGGPVGPRSLYEVVEKGEPEMLQVGARSYLMTGASAGNVTPLDSGGSSVPVTSGTPGVAAMVDEMRALRGDLISTVRYIVRANNPGAGEELAPLLREGNELLRRMGGGAVASDSGMAAMRSRQAEYAR